MLELVAKRVLAALFTLLAASLLYFGVIELLPGDFANAALGRRATPEALDMLREEWGLYRPLHVRYLDWLSHILVGDFGTSWSGGYEISTLLWGRLGNTLFLAIASALVSMPIAIWLGMLAAMKRETRLDRGMSAVALTTLSIPEFVVGYIVVLLFAITLPIFPPIALFTRADGFWEKLYVVALPVLTLSLASIPNVLRLTRAAILGVLSRPFVEMAILKSVGEKRIFWHHVLPHATAPIINIVLLALANLIVGVIIVEIVFAFPGVGQLLVDAVLSQDVPTVQACGLIFTSVYIVLVLIADLVTITSNPQLKDRVVHSGRLRYTVAAIATIAGLSITAIYAGQYLERFRYDDSTVTFATVAEPGDLREHIRREHLFAPTYVGDGPVHNGYFLPVGDSGAPRHRFQGTLEIAATELSAVRVGARTARTLGEFPGVRVDFFSDGDMLVPVQRELIVTGGDYDIVFAPGRIWHEASDGPYSRGSFPFTLVHPRWSQSRNGLATFVFDDTEVSALRLQVVQESATNTRFDLWGQTPMAYEPRQLREHAQLLAAIREEVEQQAPLRPWQDLLERFGPEVIDTFHSARTARNITLAGVIVDGTVFAQHCRTRFGDYPYCRSMLHSVYSVSKSMGTLVGMLRLAQKYGDHIFEQRVLDLVHLNASHDGWHEVTLGDLLNMAAGIGDVFPHRGRTYVEEDDRLSYEMEMARTLHDKLRVVERFGNYPWSPGEVFRYRTTDTFLLTAALDRLVKNEQGRDASLWQLLTDEVFTPIGAVNVQVLKTDETAGHEGVPNFGYGMLITLDDLAKVATLLQNEGRHAGRQILSLDRLRQATGRELVAGLPTGWQLPYGEARYHMSLWQAPFNPRGDCRMLIPHMSGYGGNYVVLMPNGVTAFRFADGGYDDPATWDSTGLRRVADHIRPVC